MQWLEVRMEPEPKNLDALCTLLDDLGIEGLVIDDGGDFESFLENNRQYWDYVDASLLAEKKGVCAVSLYLTDDAEGLSAFQTIRDAASGLVSSLSVRRVRDEDWESNWMQYYKPIPVGDQLLIVPEWETVPEDTGRTVLKLNPGLIFGTGSHPTTAMCLAELEQYAPQAESVLDLGCGSGILAIAALILGAKQATGCDIDPKAPKTAQANASLNGIDPEAFTVYAGDILHDEALRQKTAAGSYDLILANIVADVIIALAPDVQSLLTPEGRFICSGILEGRQTEVISALENAGMRIVNHRTSDDWHCYTAVDNHSKTHQSITADSRSSGLSLGGKELL
jgi:ribosomal protein L11 methyltransferase